MNARITIRLDREQRAALGELARENLHSVGAEVRQAIKTWITGAQDRALGERLSQMTEAELRAILVGAGFDDGRQNDASPGSTGLVAKTPPAGPGDGVPD